jgi:hypothetical protein
MAVFFQKKFKHNKEKRMKHPLHKSTILLFFIGIFICMADADPLSLFIFSKLVGLLCMAPLVAEIIIKIRRGELE